MRSLLLLLTLPLAASCSITASPEPSLAPRAAEAIDPRLPIPDETPEGTVDPALASRLSELVAEVRSASPAFETKLAVADRLATGAGPNASESWIAAEQALSRLIEQHGVTTRAAGDIDALAASRLEGQRWIAPADRAAISAAAADVASISAHQTEAIDRLMDRLSR
jgi:hypothetical protein